MTKPRVLCLMHLPPPVHGVTVMNTAVAESALLRERFDVDIVPLQFASTVEELGGVSLRKLRQGVQTALVLRQRLARFRPHLAYVTLSPKGAAFVRDSAYVALIRQAGVPVVFHLHAQGIAQATRSPLRRALYRRTFRDAWLIHLSRLLVEDTADVAPPERSLFVPNGVGRFAPPVERTAANTLRVLFLSHIMVSKGPLVLLEALSRLHARGRGLKVTIAGGDRGDGTREQLERALREPAFEHVRYVGAVHGEAKEQLYREHDVLVHPTLDDAFPLVLIEAMRQGLAVVASRVGAIPDIVVDGSTGVLVDRDDPAALAAALGQLADDPGMAARLGARGRDRYLEQFTVDRFESALATALETALAQSARPR